MSDSLKLNNRYRKFLSIFSVFIAILLLFITIFYLYSSSATSKEKKISIQVNKILEDIIDERIFGSVEKNNKNSSSNTNFLQLSKELYEIYKKNSSSINGKRALWYSARFDVKLGDFKNSLEKILLISNDKNFYLAPNILYLQAVIYENLNQLEDSLKVIENFTKQYSEHYLNFNIRMMKAKIFLIMNSNDRAYQEYLELKKNSDYLSYTDLIEEKIQQISFLNLIKKK